MKRIVNILGAAVLATIFVGCANTKNLGSIGGTEFYRVKSSTFSGPNFSALVTKDAVTGDVRIQQVFGGPGLGNTTISAIGQVAGSAVLGISFPKNVGDNISASGGSSDAVNQASSTATSTSTSGSNASASGGTRTHPASPGNGGTPGNGGQNGGGSGHGHVRP